MCRMILFKGNDDFVLNLIEALKRASKSDIFNNFKSHKDGWGIVFSYENYEIFYKSKNPIYEEDFKNYLKNEYSYGILHARLASPQEPKLTPLNSHPFLIHGENEIIYMAHNGSIKKDFIGKKFNIDFENRTDSEVFSMMLEKLDGNYHERIKNGIDFIISNSLSNMLNLFCLIRTYENKRVICYFSNYYDDIEKTNYYPIYKYEINNNLAIMSSTVAYEMGFLDKNGNIIQKNVEKVRKNKIYFIY
ncbi:MAG: class II glutamine amidotransferase [Thermoplasmata archaeon]